MAERQKFLRWRWAASMAVAAVFALAFGGVFAAPAVPLENSPDETAFAGTPLGMRRLSPSQYQNSIRDIFGADIATNGRFDVEVRSDGLLAVGASEASVSPAGAEFYSRLARAIAAQVVAAERRARLPCAADGTSNDRDCERRILRYYATRLFRRPVTDREIVPWTRLAQQVAARNGNFHAGIEAALAGLMMSPEFLFVIERGEYDGSGRPTLEPFSRATRLSFLLWDAAPDAELLRAAASGELRRREGLERQVDRMIASPRIHGGTRAFFRDMLALDAYRDLAKDGTIYPGYTSQVAKAAPEEIYRFLTTKLLDERADYRTLFTDPRTFINRDLGILYNVPVRSAAGWERIDLSAQGRAGLLTMVGFLALHSPPGRSSPTIRGKAIRETLMCQEILPPPGNIDFSGFEAAQAASTARERLVRHSNDPGCASCHDATDPVGLAFENFDGSGASRTHENGTAIDPGGSLGGLTYHTAAELGAILANDPSVPACLTKRLYSYGVGRAVSSRDRPWTKALSQAFSRRGYVFPELLKFMTTSDEFYRVDGILSAPVPATYPLSPRSSDKEL